MEYTSSYKLGFEDLLAFQLHYARTSPHLRKSLARMRVAMGAVYALMAGGFPFFLEGVSGLVASAFVLAFGIFQVATLRRAHERRIRKYVKAMVSGRDSSAVLGEKRLRLDDSGILYEEEGSTATMGLGGIKKVGESEIGYYLFRDDLSAIILPKGADHAREIAELVGSAVAQEREGGGA